MSRQRITAPKLHKFIPVDLHWHDTFKLPGVYERLSAERIIGLDTETFAHRKHGAKWIEGLQRYTDGYRTDLTSMNFSNAELNTVLETTELDHPFEAVFDCLFPLFSIDEEKPSWTKQRPRQERTGGVNKGQVYRGGRRQHIEPIVLIMFNLEYDLGRLIRSHPQFGRAIAATMDSIRVPLGKYEVEIAQLLPSGNAASFELYVRYDGKIMRLIGRDAWAYIKSTLEEAAECFLGEQKDELDTNTFNRLWEELTEQELARLKAYAAKDAKLTRELYEVLITLLTSIDIHAICRDGLLPKSAAGAAAKIAFSMTDVKEWKRPPRYVMEQGALSYAGGRVFNRKPGYYRHINVFDMDSAHAFLLAQLPDPATCEYIDIEPGPYNQDEWRGKFGVMQISGEGLDEYYPALRVHDEYHQRLRYIYGPFQQVHTTIPEIVYGIESGRLRVDHIHEGTWIKGANENSFLRKFASGMYDIKQEQPHGSPLYNLAKLLVNALAGKLAEINLDRPYIDPNTRVIPFPDVPLMKSTALYEQLHEAYIQRGEEGVEDIASNLHERYPSANEVVPFQDIIDRHIPAVGKAGAYYLPMHAAQVTGLASARLGLAAYCTNAINGHTDSLFVIGDQSDGFRQFHEIERSAGYESPETGMGSFKQEVDDGWGILLKGNLYAIRHVDKETGEVLDKCATHGLPGLGKDKDTIYNVIERLESQGYIQYTTKPAPRTLRASAMLGKEPGIFISRLHQLKVDLDPNMTINSSGERVWKPYQPISDSEDAIPPNIPLRSENGNILVSWSQFYSIVSNKYDLSHDTTALTTISSILHDATRHRSNSGLNRTEPSRVGMKSPRLKVVDIKNDNTLASTNGRSGSTRSYTNANERIEVSVCKNPQAGSSPST